MRDSCRGVASAQRARRRASYGVCRRQECLYEAVSDSSSDSGHASTTYVCPPSLTQIPPGQNDLCYGAGNVNAIS